MLESLVVVKQGIVGPAVLVVTIVVCEVALLVVEVVEL